MNEETKKDLQGDIDTEEAIQNTSEEETASEKEEMEKTAEPIAGEKDSKEEKSCQAET